MEWKGTDHLLTAKQVAEKLGICPTTVGRIRRKGHLPGVQIGNAWRYHPDDLTTYVNQQRRHTKALAQ